MQLSFGSGGPGLGDADGVLPGVADADCSLLGLGDDVVLATGELQAPIDNATNAAAATNRTRRA